MVDFLKKIDTTTRKRLAHLDSEKLRQQLTTARTPLNFLQAFSDTRFPVIAEVKFASPSAGQLSSLTDPVSIARAYVQNGAAALSILTEPDFFQGDLTFLQQIRLALPDTLLLMKDFVLSELQLWQARIYGADAVLLIVAFLSPQELSFLYQQALRLQLTPLIEVHNAAELAQAMALRPSLIGINNRDLSSLRVDLAHSRTLLPLLPKEIIAISESGITTGKDLLDLQQYGYRGFLIGSHFMKTGDPGAALANLLQEANHLAHLT